MCFIKEKKCKNLLSQPLLTLLLHALAAKFFEKTQEDEKAGGRKPVVNCAQCFEHWSGRSCMERFDEQHFADREKSNLFIHANRRRCQWCTSMQKESSVARRQLHDLLCSDLLSAFWDVIRNLCNLFSFPIEGAQTSTNSWRLKSTGANDTRDQEGMIVLVLYFKRPES